MIRESVKMSGAGAGGEEKERKKAEQTMTEKEGGKSFHVPGFGSLSKDPSSS